MKSRGVAVFLAGAALLAAAPAARAFTLAEIESDLALTADERAQLEQGQVVDRMLANSTERELAVGLAVQIAAPPAQLEQELYDGLAQRQNPDVIARGAISTGAVGEFAGVRLPNAAAAQAYLSFRPGPALNLSAAEIAAFQALAGQPAAKADPKAAVESLIRQQLQARYQAYRAKGLAGIAPYARGSGQANPGEDLLAATRSNKLFAKYAPGMVKVLTSYPAARPADLREKFEWLLYNAHGDRAIILAHYLAVPDGDAWTVGMRQYYVSTSYDAEQNMMLLVPTDAGGTVAIAVSRVSTEQVAGFGGSMKRGIGSKLMGQTLSELAQKIREAAGKK